MYIALKIKTTGYNKLSPISGGSIFGIGIATKGQNYDLQKQFLLQDFTSEQELLKNFYQTLENWWITAGASKEIIWITWNGRKFDVPFLIHRSLINSFDASTIFRFFPSFKDFIPFMSKSSPIQIKEISPICIPKDNERPSTLADMANAYGLQFRKMGQNSVINSWNELNKPFVREYFDKLHEEKSDDTVVKTSKDEQITILANETNALLELGGFAI